MPAVPDKAAFDIAPFRLPNCAPNEVRFEEPREVARVVATFDGPPPTDLRVEYLSKYWPEGRWRLIKPFEDPCWYGWMPTDDMFNCEWREAKAGARADGRAVEFTVRDYGEEDRGYAGQGIDYRKTLGVRLASEAGLQVAAMEVYTTGTPTESHLEILLDAGSRSPGDLGGVSGYSAVPGALQTIGERAYSVEVAHMNPARWDSGDDGLVILQIGAETVTLSLTAVNDEGPIWVEHLGLFAKLAEDPTTFEDYRRKTAGANTLNSQVLEHKEQSFAGASNGQPRPHPCSTNLGRPNSRHRFRLEANADLVLEKANVERVAAGDTPRFKCKGTARFFFGFETWTALSRYPDPAPAMAYNQAFRNGDMEVRVRSIAVPIDGDPNRRLRGDESTVALMRFQFQNRGPASAEAQLPIGYSQDSRRSENAYADQPQDDYLVPFAERDDLCAEGGALISQFQGEAVCRAHFDPDRRA